MLQQRLLAVLADGAPHTPEELKHYLDDDLAGPTAVKFHISRIRKLLAEVNETILCEYQDRRTFYRHVRLVHPNGE
jgi:hypothetical protein